MFFDKRNNKNSNSTICFENEIAVYGLNLLLQKVDREKIFILCNAADTGIDTWQPSLLKAAQNKNLRIVSLEECYTVKNLIFLSLEFDRIISPKKFSNARLYNIHFSKLPSYKGMFTSALPLINGEKETGVTLHKIDAGIDTGDIIDGIKFQIKDSDTARDIYYKYSTIEKVVGSKLA